MTAPTIDPRQSFAEMSDRIFFASLNQRMARAAKRLAQPEVMLYDGDWNPRGRVAGEIDASFQWKLNDVGAGRITLPLDHHLAKWAVDVNRRDTENIHVTVDKNGARWSGRMQSVKLSREEDGSRKVEINFLDDIQELEKILVWPNPFLPAGVQFPKSFVLAGPSAYMLKLTLFLNILRLNGNLWQLPDDPLDASTWFEGIVPWDWSIAVQPDSLIMDDSEWCIIDSRMKTFMELARPILENAGLMITTRRWLHGDPRPKGWITPLRNGQLIVDIVDKSGVFDQTAFGGTIFGGLARTITTYADNLVDGVINTVKNPLEPAEYSVSKWLGTKPSQPWVVFRDGQYSQIGSGSWTHEPATAAQITVGGKSAPGVNEAISMSVKLAGNIIGSTFLVPTAGDIADTALKPLYEDVFLAFGSIKSPLRTRRSGWSYYHEERVEGAESAWALSGIMAFRQGFYDTRSRVKHEINIGDGGPYLPGAQGQGHFWLGDRIGVQLQGVPGGRVMVEQVQAIDLGWSRDSAPVMKVTVGDPKVDQAPLERLLNQSRQFFEMLSNLGVTK